MEGFFYTALLLKNRNGGEDDVIATRLSEPAQTVAQHLRDLLSLPEAADVPAQAQESRAV